MKQSYIFCLLFISLFSSAQIINFTDGNFKMKLLEADETNLIAKNLSDNYFKIDANNNNEIEISEAIEVSYIDIWSSNISNLDGIANFSNLKTLNCHQNQISNLNINGLTNLEFLNCSNNPLTILNHSNAINLTELDCSYGLLTNLDISNLTNLIQLNCSNNQITNLNTNGITNLDILKCGNNQFTNLNLSNITNLAQIYCSEGLVTNLTLSNLPNLKYLEARNCQMQNLNLLGLPLLEVLDCGYNLLQSIDINNFTPLKIVVCEFNQLSSLSINNLINLQTLKCSNNQLTEINIQELDNIWYLDFSNNQVSTLNANDKFHLDILHCSNNQLTSLFLKNGLDFSQLEFNGNPNLQYICCDDNQIEIIQLAINSYGYANTCNVNSYCSFTDGNQLYSFQGQQKYDDENDSCDTNDGFIPNFKFSITNGVITGTIISNITGNYSINVQAGQHTITPILENPNYFTVSPNNVVIDFPTQISPLTQNFCVTPNGIKHDVEVSIIPTTVARPGFDATYKIIYKNKGNQIENGTLNLLFDDAVLDVVSTNPIVASQSLNNLNWTYNNLQPFETREITVVLNINSPMETPAVNAGDVLNYAAQISQLGLDEMLYDNAFGLKQTVVNSYDPNDKTCLQGNTISPDKVGEFVHYMIRFENTGTFPAENIVVKDIIDTTKFDVSSLIPLHASHNYTTKISENYKVEFIFENINLPFDDANNDGYIAFKIKTLPTLVLGDTFSNSANIYFDYNFPIVTNTATTTIAALSNPSFEFANYFSLYPNPTTNELNIKLKSANEINSIQIYNTIGQLVTVQTGNALKVDVSNLKTGNYFIKINTNEGFSTSQFIKE